MKQAIWNVTKAGAIVALIAAGFVAVSGAPMKAYAAETAAAPDNDTAKPGTSAYRLDTGDKVKVTVYGEDDLSGEFDVDGSGFVRLPLIGQVRAAGLSLREFENAVEAKLAAGYLVNPKVSVEVTNYRPFTILGEVNKPGEYPYENGMTVLNAVALGGGYTYRADKDEVYIRRKGSQMEVKLPADDRTAVYPGDTVRVDERIF
ncbi:MAG TPA: polysaccharide biosynthesis/export family protein [Rhizomicrobium sp.]|nr:polysaccharide biosynthesis/export family protein [Rhizomicrobium sp.]